MTTTVHEEQTQSGLAASIVVITVFLMAIGLVMVASTTTSLDYSIFDKSIWQTTLGRQGAFLFLGAVAMLVFARLGTRFLDWESIRRRVPVLLFIASLLLLVATLLPGVGDERRGSHRWLAIGPAWAGLGFQPSELAKLTLVVFLAWLLGCRGKDPGSLWGSLFPGAASVGICVMLVGIADFGTAVLIGGVGFLVLLAAGCRLRHLTCIALLGAIGFGGLLLAAPYRLKRITAYGDFWADPQGAGYQPLQSLVTIASGGWFGKGLGGGFQKYGYLPDSHSDFIFAVLCEETGFVGGTLVIAAFCALTWLGLRATWTARSRFERLLAFGITATIGLQAAMNIAVVVVMTPTTGIPLPLISVGGSGVVVLSVAIGTLAAIARRGRGPVEARYAYSDSGAETAGAVRAAGERS